MDLGITLITGQGQFFFFFFIKSNQKRVYVFFMTSGALIIEIFKLKYWRTRFYLLSRLFILWLSVMIATHQQSTISNQKPKIKNQKIKDQKNPE